MTNSKKIIVAPLNWGLGHASRCVPIIQSLLKENYTPIIASDGNALVFLQKEFPKLESIELPFYNITYSKNLKWSLFKKVPAILKTAKKEKEVLEEYLKSNSDVIGLISDNRFGIYSRKIPSVYITHQINVFSGIFTGLTSYFHQKIIKKFDECWIPDEIDSIFSGKLSKSKKNLNQKYIGILSRFQKNEQEIENDILILLSGPEPNRTSLENKLKEIFHDTNQKVCLVQGKIASAQKVDTYVNMKVVNFMLSEELEKTLNSSKIVICRSGYSSIMDLITLNKQGLLIPTKNQNEQEYLARYLKDKDLFDFIDERDLSEKSIDFKNFSVKIDFEKKKFDTNLFSLFKRK